MTDPDETWPPIPDKAERRRLRPIMLVITLGIILAIVLALGGCASDRFLTEQQDADMKRICEPAGCHVVPLPLWRDIKRFLDMLLQQKDA